MPRYTSMICRIYSKKSNQPFIVYIRIEKSELIVDFNQLARFAAEREGFEPPEPLSSTVFKTAAIDHSAISPSFARMVFHKSDAKVNVFF